MGLNVIMEPCDIGGRGAGVNGRVKMKIKTTELSKSLPTTQKKISSSNLEGCSEGQEGQSMKWKKY